MEEGVLLRINKDVIKRKIVGETILLDIKRSRLLLLNKQAEIIWGQIKDTELCKEANILKALQYKYPNTSIVILQTDVGIKIKPKYLKSYQFYPLNAVIVKYGNIVEQVVVL